MSDQRATLADWAKPNPVTDNRSGLIGKAVDRYDGPAKVTGTAAYAFEVETPSPALYGILVTSRIAKGRITAVDTASAEAAPGVRLVWTHLNIPETFADPEGKVGFAKTHFPLFRDDRVRFFAEPVGLVVADTFENAVAAAQLVGFTYEVEGPATSMDTALDQGEIPTGDPDLEMGDFEAAFAASPVRVDGIWRTPVINHCQMEPHATVAWWEGDVCVTHTSTQVLKRSQVYVSSTLGIPQDKVRVFARYIGGGFGGKVMNHWDLILAPLAARALSQPVKITFTRHQMFHATVHRPGVTQEVRLGANPDGRLTAISMMTWSHCDSAGVFTEPASRFARNLYAAPVRRMGLRRVRLDLPPPGPLRSPGEAPGMMSLECAMDELAEQLGMDPVELRIRNEPESDPETGKPFSTRQLVRCMREGAQRFGWDRRAPVPGQVRDGRWLVGMGMAAAVRGSAILPAKAGMGVDADGVVTLSQAMTDIGTGSYTILQQIAAETMGVPLEQVSVNIGLSDLPPAPGSGGQFGAVTAGSAALAAGMSLRKALAQLAAEDPDSPLHGGPAEAATFQDGMIAIGNRSERLSALVSRAAPDGVYREAASGPAADQGAWDRRSYGAQFAEVGVDTVTGEVRVRRMLGVYAAGRILNAKTARSQLTGGMIWGVGAALTEGNYPDPRYGSFVSQDLASYLAPTHADIGELEAIMLDEEDPKANPLGAKGVGELGIAGSPAAIVNAVHNACGLRVRDYPVTPDKVLAHWKSNPLPLAARGRGVR